MDLLIVRHAESEHNIGATEDLNSELTSDGHIQAMITGDWLNRNFENLAEFQPFTSPYLRALQTAHYLYEASNLEPFSVEEHIREFHIEKNEKQLEHGGMFVPTEPVLFEHFKWPNAMEMGFFFPNETLGKFFERLQGFLSGLDQNGKYLFVSHAVTCRAIHALAIGGDLDELHNRYYDKSTPNEGPNIKNCSLTLVRNGETKWFSKIVYDLT